MVIERNIDEDHALHRELFDRIPVIELGSGRLELATSVARLRRLFADVLDSSTTDSPEMTPSEAASPSTVAVDRG